MDRSVPDRFLGVAPEASSSSRRSRSPIACDLDNPEGLPKVLVVAWPRIRGCPTPIPPTPRPVISGQKTPAPPKAKPKSGPSRAPELVSSSAAPVPATEIPDNPPLELCKLHKASAGLNEVLFWLTQAIGLGYRHIISLGQHHVADRCVSQTREVLQVATREHTLVCVLSYIPERSFRQRGDQALALWRDVVSSCAEYPLRPLPLIVTPEPLGPWGKAATLRWLRERLWRDHGRVSWAIDPISVWTSPLREESHLCTGTFAMGVACCSCAGTRVPSEKGKLCACLPNPLA